jgi:hypothetical protein
LAQRPSSSKGKDALQNISFIALLTDDGQSIIAHSIISRCLHEVRLQHALEDAVQHGALSRRRLPSFIIVAHQQTARPSLTAIRRVAHKTRDALRTDIFALQALANKSGSTILWTASAAQPLHTKTSTRLHKPALFL